MIPRYIIDTRGFALNTRAEWYILNNYFAGLSDQDLDDVNSRVKCVTEAFDRLLAFYRRVGNLLNDHNINRSWED